MRAIEKPEVELELSFKHGHWVSECVPILADGKEGKPDRRKLGDDRSRVPYRVFQRLKPRLARIIEHREEQTFAELKEKLVAELCLFPRMFGGQGKEDRCEGDVGWFNGHERYAAIQVIEWYEHGCEKDDKKLADELRARKDKIGKRFRRMEDRSKAPLRFAFVVMHNGSFARFVPAAVQEA